MDSADKLNVQIDECISHLADDSIDRGGEALHEIAILFAKSGAGIESFMNMRKYIINEAEKKTSAAFIQEKLRIFEQQARERRNGGSKIIIH